MTEVENQPLTAALAEDVYDPDDVGLRDSPLLKAMKVTLTPSPSPPPAAPLPQVSPDSSPSGPGRKGSNRRKNRPSQGDAVLVSVMDGGKRPEIARQAGAQPLASDEEEEEESVKGTEVNVGKDGVDELTALAQNALRAHEGQTAQSSSQPTQTAPINKTNSPESNVQAGDVEPMEDVKPTLPSIIATHIGAPLKQASPDTIVKTEIKTAEGELPPILPQSPQSNLSNGHANTPITLPSISDQLGDINHLTEAAATADSPFSQSPPGRPGPPRFSAIPGQGSPPKSPHDSFRPQLPSPGRGAPPYFYGANSIRRPSQAEGGQYSSAEYSTPSTSTGETPSTDQSGATPAIPIDRMSIDGITNPQIGGFQCTYPGCTAQPFQTQYLLNSHANVHSSNRPHYCSVKGCPRSEGGKGFKRKNEMIRHGLVHDSPGYVCPFCPDREHKYPRPDNLQRHVRVHHVDKDKDDAQLREVLSQRPEGPSRGRRRRGGTS